MHDLSSIVPKLKSVNKSSKHILYYKKKNKHIAKCYVNYNYSFSNTILLQVVRNADYLDAHEELFTRKIYSVLKIMNHLQNSDFLNHFTNFTSTSFNFNNFYLRLQPQFYFCIFDVTFCMETL